VSIEKNWQWTNYYLLCRFIQLRRGPIVHVRLFHTGTNILSVYLASGGITIYNFSEKLAGRASISVHHDLR